MSHEGAGRCEHGQGESGESSADHREPVPYSARRGVCRDSRNPNKCLPLRFPAFPEELTARRVTHWCVR